jgi:hypothetical protein
MKDSSFWDATFPRLLSTYAILIFALLWIGFALALAVNPGWLDVLWDWVRALPTVVEVIVWILLLPIMVGLWIWQSSWSTLVRLLAAAGLVGWTLVAASGFVKARR